MELKFAPNNGQASKPLFTGRTKDLERIFNLILSGNCIALYGERRSGKTLTLWIIQAIINGEIENYKQNLIDETLCNSLPNWKTQLAAYKAVFISLQGTRNESELLERFLDESRNLEISSSIEQPLSRLSNLLDMFEDKVSINNQKMVILLDEMETLGEYENNSGSAIAELFCNREKYSKLIFVHAGSYQWKERVTVPGSQFTHLESYYLRSIDQRDMIDYLLKPLLNYNMKIIVAKMSGSKPLYAQYMGKIIYEEYKDGVSFSEDKFLQNVSLCEQVRQNIYGEIRLDEDSKTILATLAHHPNVNTQWLSHKLNINETETKNKLKNLTKFGTIAKSSGQYQIVGNFIERYGKEICDDPTRESMKKQWFSIIQWILMIVMIALSIGFYFYVEHLSSTDLKNFNFPKGVITIHVPRTLESYEKGNLNISVKNTISTPIGCVLIFNSSDIRYTNENGRNSISFSNLEPNQTDSKIINYEVLSGNNKILKSEIFLSNQLLSDIEIYRRAIPFKKYKELLSVIFVLLSLLIPEKNRNLIGAILKKLFGVKND